MKCVFCSYEFDERVMQRSCSACLKFGACSMIKCPRCGYETPPESAWIKRMKERLKKEKKG